MPDIAMPIETEQKKNLRMTRTFEEEIYRNQDLLYQTAQHLKEQQRASRFFLGGANGRDGTKYNRITLNDAYGQRLGGFSASSHQSIAFRLNNELRGMQCLTVKSSVGALLNEEEAWDSQSGTAWGLFKQLETSKEKSTAFGIGPPKSSKASFDNGFVMNNVFHDVFQELPNTANEAFVAPILEMESMDVPSKFYSSVAAYPFCFSADSNPGVAEELLYLIDRNRSM